jgi:hypothetical protein
MTTTRESAIVRRIQTTKERIAALGDLRPGTLSEQYNVCGTPNCRCKADPPQKHGPYHQLSYTRNGRSRSESVRSEDLDDVRAQIRNYEQLRALIDEWVGASIELDHLRRSKTRQPPAPRVPSSAPSSPETARSVLSNVSQNPKNATVL